MRKSLVSPIISLLFLALLILQGCRAIEATPTPTYKPPTPESSSITTSITLIPTVAQTSTPLPTLSPEDRSRKIDSLLTGSEECKLPCLWGIVPGKTQLFEAKYKLDQFATSETINWLQSNQYEGMRFSFIDKGPFEGALGYLYIVSQNDTVIAMHLEGYSLVASNYSIQDILIEYGMPDNIFIYTLRDSYGDGQGELPFIVTLDYSSRGFLAYFHGNGKPIYEKKVIEFCYIGNAISPKIIVWDTNRDNPYLTKKLDSIYRIWPDMKTIDVAGMEKEAFYNLLIKANETQSICINTSADLWDY